MRQPQDSPGRDPGVGLAPRAVGRSAPIPGLGEKGRPASGWSAYLRDPRTAVLAFLVGAFVIGGGRKALQAIRARRQVAALGGSNPAVADVEAAADHGRACLVDLFRLLGTADRPEVRAAAGRALARLWRADELIAEEEKAVVRRGYAAEWHSRRTYPRGLRVPITIRVDFGVAFLQSDGRGVGPNNLAWSHRMTGTERAQLEEWTEPTVGVTSATFCIYPDDFAANGPHRLSLQTRVKTVGLTDAWDLELPHLACSFEFDPHLAVPALLTQADDARAARLAASVRLEPSAEDRPTTPLLLTADLLLRDPPAVTIHPPLPCDLAHRLTVEFEGIAGTWDAGTVVAVAAEMPGGGIVHFPLGPIIGLPPETLDRPGPCRLRAILTADPSLGWINPAIRSVWPDPITTDWLDARIIRR